MTSSSGLTDKLFVDYSVKKRISDRENSRLYLAHNLRTELPVFLLLLNPTVETDPVLAQQFKKRIDRLSKIDHPNIAHVKDVGVSPRGQPCAAIEHFRCTPLSVKLTELSEQHQQMPVESALRLVRSLASALAAVYPDGFSHYNLRPENIYIREDGSPVFLDLGVPELELSDETAREIVESGYLDYAAPEQIQGSRTSPKSNIYSLGILLYELLAGHRPEIPTSSWDIFERRQVTIPRATPLEDTRKGLPPEIYRLIRNCLWQQEWNRYESPEVLVAALDQAIEVLTNPKRDHVSPALKIRRRLITATALLIIFVPLGFVLFDGNGGGRLGNGGQDAVGSVTLSDLELTGTAGATLQSEGHGPGQRDIPVVIDGEKVQLISPVPGKQIFSGSPVLFQWQWDAALTPGAQFGVYLVTEGGGILLGSVSADGTAAEHALMIDGGLESLEGSYRWQVILEDSGTGEMVGSSRLRTLTIVPGSQSNLDPTPTIAAPDSSSPTSTPTATDTPTATPTVAAPTAAPTLPPSPTAEPVCQIQNPGRWIRYTIGSGDNLSTMALRTGTTVERIMEVNCLDSIILTVGSRILLPSLPTTPTPSAASTTVPGGTSPTSAAPTQLPTLTPPPAP